MSTNQNTDTDDVMEALAEYSLSELNDERFLASELEAVKDQLDALGASADEAVAAPLRRKRRGLAALHAYWSDLAYDGALMDRSSFTGIIERHTPDDDQAAGLSSAERDAVADKLRRAERLADRTPEHAEALRAEVAEIVGVDVEALDTTALTAPLQEADDDRVAPPADVDVEALDDSGRAALAAQKRDRADMLESRLPERAEALRAEAAALEDDRDALTAIGGGDVDDAAVDALEDQYDVETLANSGALDEEIEALESRVDMMRERAPEHADRLEARLEALRARRQEVAR